MVKNVVLILVIIGLVVLGYYVARRADPPPPPERGMPMPPPPGAERMKIRRAVVMEYHSNAHLDVNSIQLRTVSEGVINVDFRPHTAQTVMSIAPIGDSVEVTTFSRPNDESVVYQLHRIENLRDHRVSDLDALPPPPDVPPDYRATNFTIQHPQILTDPYGGIDAIRDGVYLFHFKPGLVDDISGLIKSAQLITMSAIPRSESSGFVNIHHDKVYIVLSLTIDNKTFLVR